MSMARCAPPPHGTNATSTPWRWHVLPHRTRGRAYLPVTPVGEDWVARQNWRQTVGVSQHGGGSDAFRATYSLRNAPEPVPVKRGDDRARHLCWPTGASRSLRQQSSANHRLLPSG